jgi:uncharacterized protein YgbK (DUF1537 family)
MNRVGLGQVARLLDRGAGIVTLDTGRALDNPAAAAEEVAPELARQLRTSLWVVLTLVDPRAAVPELGSALQARGLNPGVATDQLMLALGGATDQAMSSVAPAAIVLTGGDTARAVCSALGTQSLDVYREAAPGVPISLLQGGRWDGLPVVTKAGGFGDVETLVNVIQQLEALRA